MQYTQEVQQATNTEATGNRRNQQILEVYQPQLKTTRRHTNEIRKRFGSLVRDVLEANSIILRPTQFAIKGTIQNRPIIILIDSKIMINSISRILIQELGLKNHKKK